LFCFVFSFFFLRKSIIVGAGYIAVELAGILQTLGSDVTMVIRHDTVSHGFISQLIDETSIWDSFILQITVHCSVGMLEVAKLPIITAYAGGFPINRQWSAGATVLCVPWL
jgi:thioredoxin reductase